MRYAVFDLGSNSIKCVMAETRSQGIRILHEESIGTRLAENLIDTCELRPEAIARTLDALRLIRAKADELGIERFRAVATSAVPRQPQSPRVPARSAGGPGVPVRLLSGSEEAETIFNGVIADPHWRGKDVFILDIGGGQRANGSRAAMASWKSGSVCPWVPCGCANGFLHEYPVRGRHGEPAGPKPSAGRLRIPLAHYTLGIAATGRHWGATITCLVAIHKKLAHFDPKQIDHAALTLEQVRALQRSFTGMTLEKTAQPAGTSSQAGPT